MRLPYISFPRTKAERGEKNRHSFHLLHALIIKPVVSRQRNYFSQASKCGHRHESLPQGQYRKQRGKQFSFKSVATPVLGSLLQTILPNEKLLIALPLSQTFFVVCFLCKTVNERAALLNPQKCCRIDGAGLEQPVSIPVQRKADYNSLKCLLQIVAVSEEGNKVYIAPNYPF